MNRGSIDELVAWLRQNRPLKWGSVPVGDLSFTIAELDFIPPALPPFDEAIEQKSWYSYGPVGGCTRLRQAVLQRIAGRSGVALAEEQICITPGVRSAFEFLVANFRSDLMEIVFIGVAIYELFTTAARKNNLSIRLETDIYKILAELEVPSVGRRMYILCNPGVPDGRCYDRETLRSLCAGAQQHGHILVCDEVFMDFVNEPTASSMVSLIKEAESLIVLSSFTKSFGLGALRIGYLISSETIVARLLDNKPMMELTPSTASQDIALRHLNYAEGWHRAVVKTVEENRNIIKSEFRNLADKIGLSGIDNTFVATFNLPPSFTCMRIASETGIHLWDISGRYSSLANNNRCEMRMAFAAPSELISRACVKLRRFLETCDL